MNVKEKEGRFVAADESREIIICGGKCCGSSQRILDEALNPKGDPE